MKNTYLILIMLFVFTGCNEEKVRHQENSIFGKWSLIRYEAGFSPIEDFSENQIIWTFNNNNVLDVLISKSTIVSDRLPLNSSGKYNYTTNENELTLNSIQSYKYEITDNKLVLSTFIGIEADGMRVTFSKVNQ
ncbi:MAG: lipocalin family protein [Flavobacteriaceae bacterium]|nr:lipocalin family protein [Flavobacteriaceae bacterium]